MRVGNESCSFPRGFELPAFSRRGWVSESLRQPNIRERRSRVRAASENAATGLVEALVRDPTKVAESLLQDLQLREDLPSTLARLEAAARLVRRRGVAINAVVGAIQSRLLRRAASVAGRTEPATHD